MNGRECIRETPWHTRTAADIITELQTDPERGLAVSDIPERLEHYGPNRIRSGEAVPWWIILWRQFTDPLIYILIIAALISLIFQEYIDAIVIVAVVLINGAIGFYQEWRARKVIHALSEMSAPRATVIRDGNEQEIASEEVVPGDIVLLSAGMQVPADVRLVQVEELQVDESPLTGESKPVAKQLAPVEDEYAVPGDQFCMAFAGTNVTRGSGRGVVVRTGDASELGHIAETTQEIGEVKVPVKEKMEYLGTVIGVIALVLAVVVVVGGLLVGMTMNEIIRTSVALVVGAVPEALPIVLTVTLAVGVQRMAQRNAIIRSLPAVETLGSTTVIGSDKTGTLTANQMTVRTIWTGGKRYALSGSGYQAEGTIHPVDDKGDEEPISAAVRQTVLTGLLANEARGLPRDVKSRGGDPTELALLVSAIKAGLDLQETRKAYPQVDIIPFASEHQYMATLNETPEGRCIFLKGSPEAVLARCHQQLGLDGQLQPLEGEAARVVAGELADEGYRVLAMALRYTDITGFDQHDPGSDFIFLGFQGMEDPIRPEAVEAVQAARRAGIRVLMLTGDHARTARAIGQQLGLGNGEVRVTEGRTIENLSDDELDAVTRDVDVYARVSPRHKLRLVERLKAQGHIVAVTGDGVNDAPALQSAHLGIAMGQAGTDVAREASDMVLVDDNFASITNAVEEGRVVFANIRKVTYFLLSTGVGLVIVILSALFGPWPLPFLAVQVLWINLVTKGLQDVSLAFEPGEPGLLNEPPRDPAEGVINRAILWRMIILGLFMAIGTLGVFYWILQQDVSLELARSVAMTQMVMFQFFHVLNCRSFHRSIFTIPLFSNPYLIGSVTLALLAHLAILHVPWLQTIFETEVISLELWGMIVGISVLIIAVAEIDKALFRRRRHRVAIATRQGAKTEEQQAQHTLDRPQRVGERKTS